MNCRVFPLLMLLSLLGQNAAAEMEFVCVGNDNKGFVLAASKKPFLAWGHNYAVNEPEQQAAPDWPRIARDFDDFRKMGANVARIHLQVPHYMDGPKAPNQQALAELSQWLKLAEEKGLYLDVTGLASYHVKHRATWYDSLSDKDRWAVQACFWEAVAATCANSPAVFCYDLINEPVASGERKEGWYAGRMGDYEFIQRLSLNRAGRSLDGIAKTWTHQMVSAIHRHDRSHLMTIGMLPQWGPSPQTVGPDLDFISVHIYPETGKVADTLKTLQRFDIGKPIVVEETFPLSCGVPDLRDFLLKSRGIASGWIGQYPSETLDELLALQKSGKLTLVQSIYLSWIDLFRDVGPQMLPR